MNQTTKKPEIFLVTSNLHKYDEIYSIFKQYTSIQLRLLQANLVEIQSSDLEEIAIFSLKKCAKKLKEKLIFVEDSGLFIKQLNGFPGPYSAYIFRTLGLKGILTLMKMFKKREAYFQSSIAVKNENEIKVFTERVQGQISLEISDLGWGYDPIFIPDCDGTLTYGELGLKKNALSHRFLATQKLIKYLNKCILVD
ncbi:MAG: non-canonical purine NTP pyrophosphatase [Candidatus Heimdallarchaeota archaeon]|nr:MAG: non-canonical purine NTP pyrophosphatase [Candidatus Heimdallarchaeota archaeon]